MSLEPGTRLGSYEIVAPLGAGGMGEVFRARDTKLQRDVALKILPAAVADDPDRMMRFEREARTLAALNHPHIAQVHGLEDSGGVRAIVMELVEGEDLSTRIARGPIPQDEALALAAQILDALEAAHETGIIHRDLKPANIKVRSDGTVKVLDFGLARIVDASGAGRAGGAGGAAGLVNSPTITNAAAMTAAGIVLGTAAYMSPEQAKGRPTDKRTDVWAFGCVLYEMLSGRRAFDGEDVSDTLAAVLRGEPDWTALPPSVSSNVTGVIKRCLERDRKARIPDASVIRFLLKEEPAVVPALTPSPIPTSRRRVWTTRLVFAALAVTTLTGLAAAAYFYRAASNQPVTRFFVAPPNGNAFVTGLRPATSAAISPDGTKLAFTARDAAGKIQIWVRPVDSFASEPLPGTDGAMFPFWSPDSRSLGFFTGSKLLRIDVAGGPPQTVCDEGGRGGAWSRDNVIVFGGSRGVLSRVPAAGGESTALTTLETGSSGHRFPSFTPDGSQVLFYSQTVGGGGGALYVASMMTGQVRKLAASDTGAVYSRGYLLFARGGTLLAQEFDANALVASGDPFPVAERVETGVYNGMLGFSASETGVLTYGIGNPRTADTLTTEVVVIDRQGKILETLGGGNYVGVDLSPDGAQLVAHRHEGGAGGGGDLWLLGLQRGTTVRFTFDGEENAYPIWSPDGQRIAFFTRNGGKLGFAQKLASGAGDQERLLDLPANIAGSALSSWSPDGQALLYTVTDAKTGTDVWLLPLTGDKKPRPLLNMSFNEGYAAISPDGKWLTYHSNETGRNEVYVRPFPSGPGKWQVSTAGASRPRWRGDGKELFFTPIGARGAVAAVDVTVSGATPRFGAMKEVFAGEFPNLTHPGHLAYAVSRDGQRFVMLRARVPDASASAAVESPIAVVMNWVGGLKR